MIHCDCVARDTLVSFRSRPIIFRGRRAWERLQSASGMGRARLAAIATRLRQLARVMLLSNAGPPVFVAGAIASRELSRTCSTRYARNAPIAATRVTPDSGHLPGLAGEVDFMQRAEWGVLDSLQPRCACGCAKELLVSRLPPCRCGWGPFPRSSQAMRKHAAKPEAPRRQGRPAPPVDGEQARWFPFC